MGSKSPEMREPLNRSLFIRCRVSVKGAFNGFSELIGKMLAESNDQINNFCMHVRVVK